MPRKRKATIHKIRNAGVGATQATLFLLHGILQETGESKTEWFARKVKEENDSILKTSKEETE